MEPSYSFFADALSKFHTATEWIQALWLVMAAVTAIGVTAFITRRQGHWRCDLHEAK